MVGSKSEAHVVRRRSHGKAIALAPSLLLKARSSLLVTHRSQLAAHRSPLTAHSHPSAIDDETLTGDGGAVLSSEK